MEEMLRNSNRIEFMEAMTKIEADQQSRKDASIALGCGAPRSQSVDKSKLQLNMRDKMKIKRMAMQNA